MRSFLVLVILFSSFALKAQNTIWAYATGDWRDGPVVTISPLFQTTEQASDLDLIAYVKEHYPEFAKITDITVQRFGTIEEGIESRNTLASKYQVRKLQVKLMEQPSLIGDQ